MRAGGTAGLRVTAVVNGFEVSWDHAKKIHHYDVITPGWEVASDWVLSRTKAVEILARLQETIRPDLFPVSGAFDGKKNFFSTMRLSFDSEEFNVPFDNHPKNKKFILVRMTHVREINDGLLRPLLQGNGKALTDGNDVIMAVNLFFQKAPRMRSPMFNNNSVFFPKNKKLFPHLSIELWPGLFQSVRPTYNRLFVNVDVSTGVIIPDMEFEQFVLRFFKAPNRQFLHTLREEQLESLRAYVGDLKLSINLPAHQGKRSLKIRAFILRVGAHRFTKDGESIRIVDYFKHTHNYQFDVNTLGVRLGSKAIFPISVCKIPQQLFKHNSEPEIVSAALLFGPLDPRSRFEAISASWENLDYTKSPLLLGSGITVNRNAMTVNGRILKPPQIQFNEPRFTDLQRPGVWNLTRNRLHIPCKIGPWMVLVLAPEPQQHDVHTFITGLIRTMRERGISVQHNPEVINRNGNSQFLSIMQNSQASFILVILPANAEPLYRAVKRMGNIEKGVITQCVKWVSARGQDDNRANQYHNNLILKINAKLGGVNFIPHNSAMANLAREGAMAIGADVSHPGVGSGMPSIAAMVSSFDNRMSQYATSMRVQETRTEIIDDIGGMVEHALQTYFEKQGKRLPTRIIYLRDGVSEGEFSTVRQKELAKMGEKIDSIYKEVQQASPIIHFIVVSKRHHIRFMPRDQDSRDPQGNNNLKAGFVVDQDITHPVYPDFYLQSQPGLKGTSRPTRYVIIHNGAKDGRGALGPDQLQEMIYGLCHCYSRSTRAVKVPAPVYYADLVCRKARIHYDSEVGHFDVRAFAEGNRPHLDFFKEHFNQVHQSLQKSMYFV
ncbi:Piwi-domain-containing protein [Pluteus cervinus]|uniref:Piwi-domain-containing protein n=1 Tax=Pluteus cervinus TaxID=181527 RepID=A0ACD3AIQ8_9AGAR|nr:Piwi-domain-containing protein [Pluteus cervinus]